MTKKQVLICPVCGKPIQNRSALKMHMMMQHGQDLEEEPERIHLEKPKKDKICEHEWRDLTRQELNMINSEGKSLKELGYKVVCTECGEVK